MNSLIKFALAQIDTTVGSIQDNKQRVLEIMRLSHEKGVQFLCFPAMVLTGVQAQGLFSKKYFIKDVNRAVHDLAKATQSMKGLHVILNCPQYVKGALYSQLLLIYDGQVVDLGGQQHFPKVMQDYFEPRHQMGYIEYEGHIIGVGISSDVEQMDVVDIMLQVDAQAFDQQISQRRAKQTEKLLNKASTVFFCNQVGGQDDVVFDGYSGVDRGDTSIHVPQFRESLSIFNCSTEKVELSEIVELDAEVLNDALLMDDSMESVLYRALVLALRGYMRKTGFKDVILGLSGGLDSALVLSIACDALGANHVRTVMMPFSYTSAMSVEDAQEMAGLLGVHHDLISIQSIYDMFTQELAPVFNGAEEDVTEENLQSRIRANLLMAMSNKWNALLLNTGNKSELAMGYFTLYGDSCGGFAMLKDLYKTQVYALSRWRNSKGYCIVQRIIDRLPSAELRPDQVDQDTLLPYEVLDPILDMILDQGKGLDDLVRSGVQKEDALKVINILRRTEYKRSQGVMGPCLSQSAFGRDWKMPLAARYRM